MNDAQFREFIYELRKMNKLLEEIKDRLPVPAQYTALRRTEACSAEYGA